MMGIQMMIVTMILWQVFDLRRYKVVSRKVIGKRKKNYELPNYISYGLH